MEDILAIKQLSKEKTKAKNGCVLRKKTDINFWEIVGLKKPKRRDVPTQNRALKKKVWLGDEV